MRIKAGWTAFLVLFVLFGSIGLTRVLGVWHTETTKVPARILSGEAAGSYDPNDIRGSYDLGTISDLFGIPLSDLAVALAVPAGQDAGSFQLKELETIWEENNLNGYEVGTSSVRLFVGAYLGLPVDWEEGTGLPGAAVDILLAKGNPTAEQKDYLETHRVDAGEQTTAPGSSDETDSTEAPDTSADSEQAASVEPSVTDADAHAESERKVNGSTTWKDVEDWGVSRQQMEAVFGGSIDSLSTVIRDDCSSAGLRFSDVKTELQRLVDEAE